MSRGRRSTISAVNALQRLRYRLFHRPKRLGPTRTRVLVVNSDPALREPIARGLANVGVDVTVVVDGHDARRTLLTMSPDALILNLAEAKVVGAGLIYGPGRLYDPNKTVAFGDEPEREWRHLTAAGAIYFKKPFHLGDFVQAVTKAVDHAAAALPQTRTSAAAQVELQRLTDALPA